MKNNSKAFLNSALILTAALVIICIFMNEWGIPQVIIVILVALLAAAQWFLYFYLKKK